MFNAKICMNKKIISEEGKKEWDPVSLQYDIWAQIEGSEPITYLRVENVKDTTPGVLSEAIRLLLQQENIPQEGLKKLVFNNWGKEGKVIGGLFEPSAT